MKKPLQVLAVLLILGVGAILGSTAIQVLAGDSAPQYPPACPTGIVGCNTPINVGAIGQLKNGSLGIGYKLGDTSLRVDTANGGNLLFDVWGAAMSNELFTGTLYVTGGTSTPKPIAGQVLTAVPDKDSNGNYTTTPPTYSGQAEWRDLPGGNSSAGPETRKPISCYTSQVLGTTATGIGLNVIGSGISNPQTCIVSCPTGYRIAVNSELSTGEVATSCKYRKQVQDPYKSGSNFTYHYENGNIPFTPSSGAADGGTDIHTNLGNVILVCRSYSASTLNRIGPESYVEGNAICLPE